MLVAAHTVAWYILHIHIMYLRYEYEYTSRRRQEELALCTAVASCTRTTYIYVYCRYIKTFIARTNAGTDLYTDEKAYTYIHMNATETGMCVCAAAAGVIQAKAKRTPWTSGNLNAAHTEAGIHIASSVCTVFTWNEPCIHVVAWHAAAVAASESAAAAATTETYTRWNERMPHAMKSHITYNRIYIFRTYEYVAVASKLRKRSTYRLMWNFFLFAKIYNVERIQYRRRRYI